MSARTRVHPVAPIILSDASFLFVQFLCALTLTCDTHRDNRVLCEFGMRMTEAYMRDVGTRVWALRGLRGPGSYDHSTAKPTVPV